MKLTKENMLKMAQKLAKMDFCPEQNVFYKNVLEMVEADVEGRLLVLPCEVGTKRLYCIDDDREIYIIDAEEVTIKQMPSGKTIFEYDSCEFEYKEFGKTAFLTIEEAEAALKKMEGE